jgi:hypothetical protein
MPLEFTAVPPVPRGMNLAGPPVLIDDSYCRWMQDILVDRPGQIRMRGPLETWIADASLDQGEQIIGACETYVGSNTTVGAEIIGVPIWRGATFVSDGPAAPSGTGVSARVANYGFMNVYGNINDSPTFLGKIMLPFKFNTQYDAANKRWINNTVIDAKPALGGGVWIGVIDDVTNTASEGESGLFLWKGASKPTYDASSNKASWDIRNTSTNRNLITHTTTVASNVEPGMFAFCINGIDGTNYNYHGVYLGCVAKVDAEKVYLEKNVLGHTYTDNHTADRDVLYMSVRGFVPQYGRGYANVDPSGTYVTSGGIGTDAEGLFKAARLTLGRLDPAAAPGTAADSYHKVWLYRYSDHQFVARIKPGGTVSNTQIEIDTGTAATDAGDVLQNEAYFTLRNDAALYADASYATTYECPRYPMNFTFRRPDINPTQRTLSNGLKTAHAAPGIFNSTYAGRQWFASYNTKYNVYDMHINRVVFSSTENPENVNLSPDASDSIIIPGRENIRGIAGSNSGLLVFVESKTYIIRGTNRQNFSLEELYPDGCLSTSSIVQVGGGVIWAGKQGIYYYDGATVRNFTPEALGVYYTDGIKNFDTGRDRIYAFVYNNYLVINFTNWFSNYSLRRWTSDGFDLVNGEQFTSIKEDGAATEVTPDRITFCIYLPTGSIGTFSNFTPRGYMQGIMCMNTATNRTAPPTGNEGAIFDLRTLFTENVDNFTRDGDTQPIVSNDSAYSTSTISRRFEGPDFYLETKQYNFNEFTLNKWWRKLMFNIRVNQGEMMIEFVDINDNSLVSPVTNSSPIQYNGSDESGFFFIPATSYAWEYYQNLDPPLTWATIEATSTPWVRYFQGVQVRYSRWMGVRRNALGFRLYGLRGYTPDTINVSNKVITGSVATLTVNSLSNITIGDNINVSISDTLYDGYHTISATSTTGSPPVYTISYPVTTSSSGSASATGTIAKEIMPEIIDVTNWIWGLKPLRTGRN